MSIEAAARAKRTRRSIPRVNSALCSGVRLRAKRDLPSERRFIGMMAITLCSSFNMAQHRVGVADRAIPRSLARQG